MSKTRAPLLPGFAPTAPYVKGSATSKAAAASIRGHLNDQQNTVLKIIRDAGKLGATDEEIASTGLVSANAARPRRVELADKGFIVKSGKRKTKSGRYAQVWIASEFV